MRLLGGYLKLALLLVAISSAIIAQQVPGVFSPRTPRPSQSQGVKPLPLGYSLPRVAAQELGPLSEDERAPRPRNGARQIGVLRAAPNDLLAGTVTRTLSDGRQVFRLAIRSEGAIGLRVHFQDFSLGAGQAWVYDPQHTSVAGPYTGKGLFGGGEFWSGTVASDEVIIEFDAPAGTSLSTLPFHIDAISHQWASMAPQAATQDANTAAPCELDVSCYSEWAKYASGVATYNFIIPGGAQYICSGAFVNTPAGTVGPYMLTAHHCISSSYEASSMEYIFNYQTSSCNGAPPDFPNYGNGTTYLVGAPISQGDFTLLRLGDLYPPQGAYLFGWSNTTPQIGGHLVGIHHPEGSWARIAFGFRTLDETFNIDGSVAPANLYYQISYDQGVVEPGSSGSPLLNSKGEIIGTLTGIATPGQSQTICDIHPAPATYSRFSTAYKVLAPYLNASPAPEFTVSPQSLAFTQTNGAIDNDQVITVKITSPSFVPVSATAADPWLEVRADSPLLVNSDTPAYIGVRALFPRYSPSGTYNSSVTIKVGTGAPVTIPVTMTVNNTKSAVVAAINPGDGSWAYGSFGPPSVFRVSLTETNGVGTTITAFKVAGQDVSRQIPNLFGSSTILPWESVSAEVQVAVNPSNMNQPIEVDGIDPGSGATWSQILYTYFDQYPPGSWGEMIAFALPGFMRPNPATPDCLFRSHITVQATQSSPISLTWMTPMSFHAPEIASWLGSSYIPAGTSIQSDICWPDDPSTHYSASGILMSGLDGGGHNVASGPNIRIADFPLTLPPLTVSTASINFSYPSTTAVSVDPGSSTLAWSATTIYSQQPASWLSVTPSAGMGAGALRVSVNPAGLIPGGVYRANLIIQSENSTPQYQNIPVTLQMPSTGISVFNGASFAAGVAPGMVLSLSDPGVSLASGKQAASSVPLPLTMQGTSVTVNNIPTPLYYVSPEQLNVQVPYEVPPGPATLTISNTDGLKLTQPIYVNAAAPGIFSAGYERHLEPNVPAKAGGYATLYLTGQGPVYPAVTTGAAPPSPAQVPVSGLPKPYADVKVYVNGVKAQTSFVGIPYYLVGITQVDFIVPPDTPAGTQPVVVVVGDTPSNTAYIEIRP